MPSSKPQSFAGPSEVRLALESIQIADFAMAKLLQYEQEQDQAGSDGLIEWMLDTDQDDPCYDPDDSFTVDGS